MPRDCAFLDASVLYPASLRNLLMRLTLAGLFEARWSDDVHEEWIRAVMRDRPDLSLMSLRRVRDAMNEHAEDSIVSGYEPLIETLDLPDPNDRHVLAAAITGQANMIVTRNLKDFPRSALICHDIIAKHPDEFLIRMLRQEPEPFLEALRDQQDSLRRPPVSMTDLLAILERTDLKQTVKELRRLIEP